jgi:hypothetical protein
MTSISQIVFHPYTLNSNFANYSYYGFPNDYGSIKIAASMTIEGTNLYVNKTFVSSTVSPKFSAATKTGKLIFVRGKTKPAGRSDDDIFIVDSPDAENVSPNGHLPRVYSDAETIDISGVLSNQTRGSMFYNVFHDYSDNYVWVPPKTLLVFVIDRNGSSTSDKIYTLYNGLSTYMCFHMNRVKRVWSMKITDSIKRIHFAKDTTNKKLYIQTCASSDFYDLNHVDPISSAPEPESTIKLIQTDYTTTWIPIQTSISNLFRPRELDGYRIVSQNAFTVKFICDV